MESTGETLHVQTPVVQKIKDTVSSFYEKYARIPVSLEAVQSFDRVAKTFQSEKGKRMIESIRPFIPVLANMSEGVSAVVDVCCGALGVGFGVQDMLNPIRLHKKNAVINKIMDRSAHVKKFGIGLAKATLIPSAFVVGRPFSRGALLSARGLGSVGEFVGKTVDQMLMRSEEKQKKNVVFVASAKSV